MAGNEATLQLLTSKICIDALLAVQKAVAEYINDKYPGDHGRQYLTSITGDYDRDKDLTVRNEFIAAATRALEQSVGHPDLRLLIADEVKERLLHGFARSVEVAWSPETLMSIIENKCLQDMRDTGIWTREINELDRFNSSFYLLLKFKLQHPESYKDYIDKMKEIRKFIRILYSECSKDGSPAVYTKYLQPLHDKGITWTEN